MHRLRQRVFPDHWTVWLGQIVVYAFVLTMLSGFYLVWYYEPSIGRTTYQGSYTPLAGAEMSRAYASMLNLSFSVRAGLLVRQIHHWASLVMIAALLLHLLRIFFTGAFRAPRTNSWLLLFGILTAAMGAGFTGAVLPDDLLSGTSLAIMDGTLKAIPLVGPNLSSIVFDGGYPGDPLRLFYPLHIVVLPLVLVGLLVLHGREALRHRPAQFAGPGRTEDNVVGLPFQVMAVKSAGLCLLVAGLVTVIAGTVQVNPVWKYGPFNPGDASAGAAPLWYLGFLDGGLRLIPPGWEFVWLGRTWTLAVLIPVGVVTLFLTAFALFPFIERWLTGDRREHHILERPRNNPARTAIGVAGMTFYGVLWATASADTVATHFHLSVEDVLHAFQVLVLAGPVVAFDVTRRICLGLQRRDRDIALHGRESGVIVATEDGGFAEVHQAADPAEQWLRASFEEHTPLESGHGPRAVLSRALYGDHVDPLVPAGGRTVLTAPPGDDPPQPHSPD
ncbi:ubiquinol-cytochrome c reductase cytochrome b subunit [Catenulispora yoronensis]|uniref:Cytochrome bc1 complex cytochrome b subunit n=1 Tax=Catenulispora yoronensis TaxID=450799 RepID=A0ABN2TSG9_9ACTN